MLTAGHASSAISGCRGASQSSSLPGPQSGCRRRAAHSRSANVRRDAVGTVVRGVAPVPQAAPSVLVEAVEPFVARLAADTVASAELRPRVEAQPLVGDEAFALFHG